MTIPDYKGYKISLSRTNNDVIIYIGRNIGGVVVFRAKSENEIKEMIDMHEQELLQQATLEVKETDRNVAEEPKETPLTPDVHRDSEGQASNGDVPAEEPTTPTKPVRGPGGKFVSNKKSFWTKLSGE